MERNPWLVQMARIKFGNCYTILKNAKLNDRQIFWLYCNCQFFQSSQIYLQQNSPNREINNENINTELYISVVWKKFTVGYFRVKFVRPLESPMNKKHRFYSLSKIFRSIIVVSHQRRKFLASNFSHQTRVK